MNEVAKSLLGVDDYTFCRTSDFVSPYQPPDCNPRITSEDVYRQVVSRGCMDYFRMLQPVRGEPFRVRLYLSLVQRGDLDLIYGVIVPA